MCRGMIDPVAALKTAAMKFVGGIGYGVEDAASLNFLREYQRSMLSVILVSSKGAAFMSAVTV